MWMVISVLISPLLAYIILAVSESDDVRTCPFCAEKIKAQARVCRHCHHDSPRLGEGLMPATFKEVFSMTWKIVVSLIIVCVIGWLVYGVLIAPKVPTTRQLTSQMLEGSATNCFWHLSTIAQGTLHVSVTMLLGFFHRFS
jgi:hypothetical protein